jgi:hypothetical protein
MSIRVVPAALSPVVTAIAWVFMAATTLGLLCGMACLASWPAAEAIDPTDSPGRQFLQEVFVDRDPPDALAWTVRHLHAVLAALCAALLMWCLASVGLLRRWAWSRVAFIGFCLGALLLVGCGFIALCLVMGGLFDPARPELAALAPELLRDGLYDIGSGLFTFAVLWMAPFGVVAGMLMTEAVRQEFDGCSADPDSA